MNLIVKLFKFIGVLLVLFSVSGGSMGLLTHAQTEDYLYIGLGFFIAIYILTPSLNKIEVLPESMPVDAIVKGNEVWEPIAEASASFCTQRLIKDTKEVISVQPTFKQVLFHLRLIFFGLFSVLVALILFVLIEPFISILPFVLAGIFFWFGFKGFKPRKKTTFYCNRAEFVTENEHYSISVTPFEQIYGLQLMQVVNKSTIQNGEDASGRYESYELNIILKDTNRINILSHGDKNAIIRDTRALASCLSVPLWHRL